MNSHGWSAFKYAAALGSMPILKYFMRFPAYENTEELKVTQKRSNIHFIGDTTPAMLAAMKGQYDCLKVLLSNTNPESPKYCRKLISKKNYEQQNFMQRPFFRLLFNIIYDLRRPEYAF